MLDSPIKHPKCVCVRISALLLVLKSTDNSFPRRKVLEVDNIFLAEDLENIFRKVIQEKISFVAFQQIPLRSSLFYKLKQI